MPSATFSEFFSYTVKKFIKVKELIERHLFLKSVVILTFNYKEFLWENKQETILKKQ
jgi:hypothetical protein